MATIEESIRDEPHYPAKGNVAEIRDLVESMNKASNVSEQVNLDWMM